MKLGNILRAAGTARPVNPRAIEFTLVGRDLNTFRHIVAPAKAVFVFVDEDQREALRVDARTSIAERFKNKVIGDDVIRDEEAYHKLFYALRDAEPDPNGLHGRFCDTVDELRQALVLPEAQRLTSEYEKYLKDEFPQLIEDAH